MYIWQKICIEKVVRRTGRATNINNVAKLKMFTVYYG